MEKKDQKDGCVNTQLPQLSKKPMDLYLNHPRLTLFHFVRRIHLAYMGVAIAVTYLQSIVYSRDMTSPEVVNNLDII